MHLRDHDRRAHPDDRHRERGNRADPSSAWASSPGSGGACRARRRHHRGEARRAHRDHPGRDRPADAVHPDGRRRCCWDAADGTDPCPARGRTGCCRDAERHRYDAGRECRRADRRCHPDAAADRAEPLQEPPELRDGTRSPAATDRRCDGVARRVRPARHDAGPGRWSGRGPGWPGARGTAPGRPLSGARGGDDDVVDACGAGCASVDGCGAEDSADGCAERGVSTGGAAVSVGAEAAGAAGVA